MTAMWMARGREISYNLTVSISIRGNHEYAAVEFLSREFQFYHDVCG